MIKFFCLTYDKCNGKHNDFLIKLKRDFEST